jgi:hypothetical protein
MLRLDTGVIVAHGDALSIVDGLLEFGGKFVEAHIGLPPLSYHLNGGSQQNFNRNPN